MPQLLHVTEVYAPIHNFIIDTSLSGSTGLVIKPNKFDEMIPILGFAPHQQRGDTGHRAANFPGPVTTLHFLFPAAWPAISWCGAVSCVPCPLSAVETSINLIHRDFCK